MAISVSCRAATTFCTMQNRLARMRPAQSGIAGPISNSRRDKCFSYRGSLSASVGRCSGDADLSNDTDQPEDRDDHHNASKGNRKVHKSLLCEPSILVL